MIGHSQIVISTDADLIRACDQIDGTGALYRDLMKPLAEDFSSVQFSVIKAYIGLGRALNEINDPASPFYSVRDEVERVIHANFPLNAQGDGVRAMRLAARLTDEDVERLRHMRVTWSHLRMLPVDANRDSLIEQIQLVDNQNLSTRQLARRRRLTPSAVSDNGASATEPTPKTQRGEAASATEPTPKTQRGPQDTSPPVQRPSKVPVEPTRTTPESGPVAPRNAGGRPHVVHTNPVDIITDLAAWAASSRKKAAAATQSISKLDPEAFPSECDAAFSQLCSSTSQLLVDLRTLQDALVRFGGLVYKDDDEDDTGSNNTQVINVEALRSIASSTEIDVEG